MILYIAEVHVGYAVQEFCKAFVSLCNGRAEFVAVHVKIIEQPGEAAFGGRTLCGCFDMVKHTLQGFIQIFVVVGSEIDIAKQLGRKNKEALFFYQAVTSFLSFGIRHFCIVKSVVSGFLFTGIDIACQVFGNVSIKHRAKNIVLKIPAVNGTTKFISDCPYRTVQLVTLLLFLCINHCFRSPFHQV